jgi:hypothetical protein
MTTFAVKVSDNSRRSAFVFIVLCKLTNEAHLNELPGPILQGMGCQFLSQSSAVWRRRQAYGAVETSLNASGVLRGALFWEWLSDGESATLTGVRETDSTWQCAAALQSSSPLLPDPEADPVLLIHGMDVALPLQWCKDFAPAQPRPWDCSRS